MPEPKERPKKTENTPWIETYGDALVVFPVSFAISAWILSHAIAVIVEIIN